jgi:hypothetical protein
MGSDTHVVWMISRPESQNRCYLGFAKFRFYTTEDSIASRYNQNHGKYPPVLLETEKKRVELNEYFDIEIGL